MAHLHAKGVELGDDFEGQQVSWGETGPIASLALEGWKRAPPMPERLFRDPESFFGLGR